MSIVLQHVKFIFGKFLASAPLLESIHHLEEKISAKDQEYEKIFVEREITISLLNSEKGISLCRTVVLQQGYDRK